jgi:uncharacterized 2Fe-2S/4Fe-4S cluster protein (DUF4445 family)
MMKSLHSTLSYQIEFKPMGKSLSVEAGTTISAAACQAGIEIVSTCGGKGKCGQCGVLATGGEISSPAKEERKLFSESELSQGNRLACCTKIMDKLLVHIPEKTLNSKVHLQVDTGGTIKELAPMVKSYEVSIPYSRAIPPGPDFERILAAMEKTFHCKNLKADHRVVAQISKTFRQCNGRLSLFLRKDVIVGVAPPNTRPVGLAIDLGTTKISAHLMDLVTGEELSADGALNPQVRYGDDIMSRLHHASSNTDSGELSSLIHTVLNKLMNKIVNKAGMQSHQVVDVCIVANTAMVHLMLDLPVQQLAKAPYVAATLCAFDIRAREIGLDIAPGAYVHILPSIGGFIGADHVAMILASEIDSTDKVVLGVDIGTNTEIVLSLPDSGNLYSISCPSGPAFEGAHTMNGMRASSGAIETVQITGEGVYLKTIGNSPAIGLCGSGIIDTMAELYRCGLINERGRFQDKDKKRFLLVPKAKSGTGKNIYFSQSDVNEIQLAKGSIRAGIDILLKVAGIKQDALQEVLVAGAFGSCLDLDNALSIGLFPDFPAAYYSQVGNAAAVGAKQALLSSDIRERARQIAARAHHINLTSHPDFNRCFALGMLFPIQETRRKEHAAN